MKRFRFPENTHLELLGRLDFEGQQRFEHIPRILSHLEVGTRCLGMHKDRRALPKRNNSAPFIL